MISRVQDKVVVGEPDFLRYLSSTFDLIVSMDTNTKLIEGERISACGIIHSVLQHLSDSEREGYCASFPWQAHSCLKKSFIFEDFSLPGNFTLLYRRGDGSTESILNHLVKHCDKESPWFWK